MHQLPVRNAVIAHCKPALIKKLTRTATPTGTYVVWRGSCPQMAELNGKVEPDLGCSVLLPLGLALPDHRVYYEY